MKSHYLLNNSSILPSLQHCVENKDYFLDGDGLIENYIELSSSTRKLIQKRRHNRRVRFGFNSQDQSHSFTSYLPNTTTDQKSPIQPQSQTPPHHNQHQFTSNTQPHLSNVQPTSSIAKEASESHNLENKKISKYSTPIFSESEFSNDNRSPILNQLHSNHHSSNSDYDFKFNPTNRPSSKTTSRSPISSIRKQYNHLKQEESLSKKLNEFFSSSSPYFYKRKVVVLDCNKQQQKRPKSRDYSKGSTLRNRQNAENNPLRKSVPGDFSRNKKFVNAFKESNLEILHEIGADGETHYNTQTNFQIAPEINMLDQKKKKKTKKIQNIKGAFLVKLNEGQKEGIRKIYCKRNIENLYSQLNYSDIKERTITSGLFNFKQKRNFSQSRNPEEKHNSLTDQSMLQSTSNPSPLIKKVHAISSKNTIRNCKYNIEASQKETQNVKKVAIAQTLSNPSPFQSTIALTGSMNNSSIPILTNPIHYKNPKVSAGRKSKSPPAKNKTKPAINFDKLLEMLHNIKFSKRKKELIRIKKNLRKSKTNVSEKKNDEKKINKSVELAKHSASKSINQQINSLIISKYNERNNLPSSKKHHQEYQNQNEDSELIYEHSSPEAKEALIHGDSTELPIINEKMKDKIEMYFRNRNLYDLTPVKKQNGTKTTYGNMKRLNEREGKEYINLTGLHLSKNEEDLLNLVNIYGIDSFEYCNSKSQKSAERSARKKNLYKNKLINAKAYDAQINPSQSKSRRIHSRSSSRHNPSKNHLPTTTYPKTRLDTLNNSYKQPLSENRTQENNKSALKYSFIGLIDSKFDQMHTKEQNNNILNYHPNQEAFLNAQ